MVGKPDEILANMLSTYRALSSYYDRGRVHVTFDPASDEQWMKTQSFSSLFMRPNFFRFDWRSSEAEGLNVVWCDGERTHIKYSYQNASMTAKSLDFAVAEAAGVSDTSIHCVPALLMDEITGLKLTERSSPSYVGSEKLNGTECHQLRFDCKRKTNVFISKEKFLLLKIHQDFSVEADTTSEDDDELHIIRTIFYDDIRTNIPVPLSAFSFEGGEV